MIRYGDELLSICIISDEKDILEARREITKKLHEVSPDARNWRARNIRRNDVLVASTETNCLPELQIPKAIEAIRAVAKEHGVRIYISRPSTAKLTRYDPKKYEHLRLK